MEQLTPSQKVLTHIKAGILTDQTVQHMVDAWKNANDDLAEAEEKLDAALKLYREAQREFWAAYCYWAAGLAAWGLFIVSVLEGW